MSLLYIGQQFTIYSGFCLLIGGIIGNAMNILIFSSVRNYRITPCTFYFLISSIYNIIHITINLTNRIITVGYGIDNINNSNIWCKFRQIFLSSFSMVSIFCSCLSSIDQYLVSSKNVYLRHYSNIKYSHRIVFILIIISFIHGIPIYLFYDISLISNICTPINNIFSVYVLIYLLGIVCIIPILIMIIFAWLTYKNIHQRRVLTQLNIDRQLIRMTLIHVGLVIISFVPYAIYNIYTLITDDIIKDTDRKLKEYFVYTIISMITYLYYAGSCYIFLISSNRFRQSVKERILFWKRKNQINPH